MMPEQGFLDAIRATPADEVSRLVYADWLEEQADSHHRYLRLELELAKLEESDPRYLELEAELQVCRRMLHPLWVHEVSRAYDLVLLSYEPTLKITAIKVIRELTWVGLAEAKNLSEALPSVILRGVSRLHAEHGRERFQAVKHIQTAIRLSTSTDRPPPLLPAEREGDAVILVRYPVSREERERIVTGVSLLRQCSFEESERYVGLHVPVPLAFI